jgi:hypothetical protein
LQYWEGEGAARGRTMRPHKLASKQLVEGLKALHCILGS